MPINPYTGKEIVDAYTPYSTESGAAPLVRRLTPEEFGSAPGFESEYTPPPISIPQPPTPTPTPVPVPTPTPTPVPVPTPTPTPVVW